MNRTAKSLARKVANGTATPAEVRGFMEAVGLLGWHGHRGMGVVNHTTNERVKSKALLAALLLEEIKVDEDEAKEWGQAAQAYAEGPDETEPAEADEAPVTVVMYRTQTPPIHLSSGTIVEALITEEVIGVTEGLCESGASLECSLEDPSMGLLRTLPESMLPGQERAIMLQCLPCYEASAEAYIRKLHRVSA